MGAVRRPWLRHLPSETALESSESSETIPVRVTSRQSLYTAIRRERWITKGIHKQIRITGRELRRPDSYFTALELDYMGLKCVGKQIHGDHLSKQVGTSLNDTIRSRFDKECDLLSEIHHPNIVQFLGVCCFIDVIDSVPILVMEFLPYNLTHCIEQYGIFPDEISYSILHDVALGLEYLHSHLIIHRDICTNNIFLTSNMTAKISDLGAAMKLGQAVMASDDYIMTTRRKTSGFQLYTPPETTLASTKYDLNYDTFSYGILMIHIVCGRLPEPQIKPTPTEEDKLTTFNTEAEKRAVFLQAIGNDHPLMNLILGCISNNSQLRPPVTELVKKLAEMVLCFPASFANRLDMLKHIEIDREEKRALREVCEDRADIVRHKENEIMKLREEAQSLNQQEMTTLVDPVIYSNEADELYHYIKELKIAACIHESSTTMAMSEFLSGYGCVRLL